MIDLKLYKNVGSDPYCGMNYLCREGSEQVMSFFLWFIVVALLVIVGTLLKGAK